MERSFCKSKINELFIKDPNRWVLFEPQSDQIITFAKGSLYYYLAHRTSFVLVHDDHETGPNLHISSRIGECGLFFLDKRGGLFQADELSVDYLEWESSLAARIEAGDLAGLIESLRLPWTGGNLSEWKKIVIDEAKSGGKFSERDIKTLELQADIFYGWEYGEPLIDQKYDFIISEFLAGREQIFKDLDEPMNPYLFVFENKAEARAFVNTFLPLVPGLTADERAGFERLVDSVD